MEDQELIKEKKLSRFEIVNLLLKGGMELEEVLILMYAVDEAIYHKVHGYLRDIKIGTKTYRISLARYNKIDKDTKISNLDLKKKYRKYKVLGFDVDEFIRVKKKNDDKQTISPA